jgi:hypothetical protein
MKQYLKRYQVAGPVGETAAEKRKRMYDLAMEQYQMFMETPAMWQEDPEMRTPDGKLNLCLDCINVDWSNPDDIMDAHRLIEEGYSMGTHYNEEAFHNGLKAMGVPLPVYNSKPAVKAAATPQKANGGVHYGAYAPPMFASGGMPCYECGGMYAEGGSAPCPPGTVPDGNGNCVSDMSTPPTPNSSLYQYYQEALSKPGMTEEIARKMIKSRRTCKPGDECWEEEVVQQIQQPTKRDGYYLEPSGNPGVGVLHFSSNDGNGQYTHKVIGPTLVRDWYNDRDQQVFFDRDPNTTSPGITYNPDIKIYESMEAASSVINNERMDPIKAKAEQRRREAAARIEQQKQMMENPRKAEGGSTGDDDKDPKVKKGRTLFGRPYQVVETEAGPTTSGYERPGETTRVKTVYYKNGNVAKQVIENNERGGNETTWHDKDGKVTALENSTGYRTFSNGYFDYDNNVDFETSKRRQDETQFFDYNNKLDAFLKRAKLNMENMSSDGSQPGDSYNTTWEDWENSKSDFTREKVPGVRRSTAKFEDGGGIPERYKNMGFTKVGVKKESTSAGKKWMVLAKKGDQYKVVHGGYDGMKDYTQHGSEDRRERFWDRMGGRDSAKAKDPFSPLYWHKRFGTWAEGGELPEMQDAGKVKERTFLGTASQFLPVYESYLDYSDLVSGVANGDKEQMYRGIVGLGQPFSGKALTGTVDYLTELFLGKDTADKNESKRSGIINMSPTQLQKLYIKYGPGGYDKWISDGMPKLEDGGDYEKMIKAGDHTVDYTYSKQLNNLENNKWNRGLAVANSLSDPRSPIHMLPDKGFGSGLKAIAGIASGLSGATLGYEKMFAKDKTERTLYNNETGEFGKREDVLKARYDKANPTQPAQQTNTQTSTGFMPYGMSPELINQINEQAKGMPVKSNMTPTGGSGIGAMEKDNNYNVEPPVQPAAALPQSQATPSAVPNVPAIPAGLENFMNGVQMKREGGLTKFWPGGPFDKQGFQNMINQQMGNTGTGVHTDMQGDGQQMGSYAAFNMQGKDAPLQFQKDWETTERGDSAGFVAANNALIGLGMANNVLGQKNQQRQYNEQLMKMGNTDSMYNAVNPSNPYGNYTTNVGIGPNFALVRQTAAQDFSDANLARNGGTMKRRYKQGGSYMVSNEELMEILRNGGDVEFI